MSEYGIDWNDPKLHAALASDGQQSFTCNECKRDTNSLELAHVYHPETLVNRIGPYMDGLCWHIKNEGYVGICIKCAHYVCIIERENNETHLQA